MQNFVKLHRDKADAWLADWEIEIDKRKQEKTAEEKKIEFEYE